MREDWVAVELLDICQKVVKVKRKEMPLDEPMIYLDIGGIDNQKYKIVGHKEYTWKDAPSRAQQIVNKGDILFSTVRTYLKNIAQVNKEEYHNQICSSGFTVIRPKQDLFHPKFAFYISISEVFLQPLNKLQTGSSYPAVRDKDVFAQRIKLPALPEQRAIVAKIEQLFSELENGIANFKTAQEQLKIYRQAVLKKAFDGELTKNSDDRKIVQLGSVIEKPKYGTSKKCSEEKYGIPVLRIPNIGSGVVKPEVLKYASFDEKEISSLALKEGDILTIRSNGSVDLVGKCALITKRDTGYLYAGYLIRIRPDEGKIDSKYLLYCLSSHYLRVQIESKAKSTSGVNNINSGEIESLKIPIFDLEEQHQVVQEIESRLSVCDKLEETIKTSLEKAEALRQSILKKAFEGQLLTQQKLEACKKEADWESAAQLLQRIKGNKGTTEAPKIAAKAKPKTVGKTISTTDMHAGVITKVIQLHENNPEYLDRLSHVKCEKIAHLAEYYVGLDLGRVPRKDAAGPDDYPHLMKVESRAKKAGFFTKVPKEIGHSYKTNRQANAVVQKTDAFLNEEQTKKLDYLLQTFLKFDLQQAEIVATTYAGWNNLLLEGTQPNDEQIVYESRENWSKRKLTIQRERFFNAIKWMREHDLVPQGTGLKVEKPIPKKRTKKR